MSPYAGLRVLWIDCAAVSYTHLDVYKRQEQEQVLVVWAIPVLEVTAGAAVEE